MSGTSPDLGFERATRKLDPSMPDGFVISPSHLDAWVPNCFNAGNMTRREFILNKSHGYVSETEEIRTTAIAYDIIVRRGFKSMNEISTSSDSRGYLRLIEEVLKDFISTDGKKTDKTLKDLSDYLEPEELQFIKSQQVQFASECEAITQLYKSGGIDRDAYKINVQNLEHKYFDALLSKDVDHSVQPPRRGFMDKVMHAKFVDELGDVMVYSAFLAQAHGSSFSELTALAMKPGFRKQIDAGLVEMEGAGSFAELEQTVNKIYRDKYNNGSYLWDVASNEIFGWNQTKEHTEALMARAGSASGAWRNFSDADSAIDATLNGITSEDDTMVETLTAKRDDAEKRILKEMGRVLRHVSMLANGIGVSMQEIVDHNHDKLVRRHGNSKIWDLEVVKQSSIDDEFAAA